MAEQTVQERIANLFTASSSVGVSPNTGVSTEVKTLKPINRMLVIGLFALLLIFPLFSLIRRII